MNAYTAGEAGPVGQDASTDPPAAGPVPDGADPSRGPGAAAGATDAGAKGADGSPGRRRAEEERRLAAEGLLEPAPLTEIPPHDRYCDLVLTGGVASGVAYPWAVVELARHYRFRQIGGTSVGAVAAALAAASEYGRCMQVPAPFEVMRRVPLELAAPSPSGLPTTLLGLFQPAPGGRRLFGLLVALLRLMSREPRWQPDPADASTRPWWQRLLMRLAKDDRAARGGVGAAATAGAVAAADGVEAAGAAGVAGAAGAVAPADVAGAVPGGGTAPIGSTGHPAPSVRQAQGARKAQTANARDRDQGAFPPATPRPDGLRPLTSLETLGFALRAFRAYLPDALRQGVRLAEAATCRVLPGGLGGLLAALLFLVAAGQMEWGWSFRYPPWTGWVLAVVAGLAGALLGAAALVFGVLGLIDAVQRDLRDGVVNNDMGLCRGLRLDGSADAGIVDWLHEGIQRAAGLRIGDRPLTFRDLWDAPRAFPTPSDERNIRLELMVTNVTLGRPYRFPLESEGDRLWYRRADWEAFFPASVLDALEQASRPYAPRSASDPADPGVPDARELPVADLPIVVAARLSMSFPFLFSSVPVYAMDYEAPGGRRLRPCQLSDGGLCSNFPIHLFDAALPRWPTFGLWLTRRLENYPDQDVWLPKTHLEGRADSFRDHLVRPPVPAQASPDRASDARSDARSDAHAGSDADARPVADLARFGLGVLSTMKDWSDHTRIRLPHVRNRVARIRLRPGEGQLFITMPPEVIRRMAWAYGTEAGRKLVAAFVAHPQTGAVSPAWRDHLYVRLQVLVRGLQELLQGLDRAASSHAHTLPVRELLDGARAKGPLQPRDDRPDPSNRPLQPTQVEALEEALASLQALEARLGQVVAVDLPYRPVPAPELRLRPPL